MLRDLTGKIAWITGAGTGIGEGAAVALAEAGMHVVLSGRRQEKLEEVAAKCWAYGEDRASIEILDVADKNEVAAVTNRILDRHRRIDVMVASAGINVKERNWHNLSVEDWDNVIRIDLDGAFYCCKAVLPAMKAQGDGLIINISSWAGKHVSVVTGPAYTAAKHAMNAMNESINHENCHLGIRACALCPGEVATEILDLRPVPPSPEDRAKMVQEDDVGRTILFIATMPAHVCLNEIHITPTWNRGYIGAADRNIPRDD